jgi:hypothetical protein
VNNAEIDKCVLVLKYYADNGNIFLQDESLNTYARTRAYLRDLPEAELHLLDGGHWALETNLDEIVTLVRDFLGLIYSCINIMTNEQERAQDVIKK